MELFSEEDNYVAIIGRPSKRKLKEVEEEERNFIKNRKEELGVEGLAKSARILKEAKETNDALAVPEEVLAAIPIPSVDSVKLPKVPLMQSQHLIPDPNFQLTEDASSLENQIHASTLPYAIQMGQYDSTFIKLKANVHLSELKEDLKRYLALYEALVFNTDVKRGNETVSHEEIDPELQRETNSVSCSFDNDKGIITFSVMVEKGKFFQGLQYLREALTQQIFTKERLQHRLTTFKNSLAVRLTNSWLVVEEVMTPLIVTQNSNRALLSFLSQYEVITSIADDLDKNEARETLKKFKEITDFITNPKRVIFHIAGDVAFVVKNLEKSRSKDLEMVLDKYFGDRFKLSPGDDLPKTSPCMAYRPFSDYRLAPNTLNAKVKVDGIGTEKTATMSMISPVENCGAGKCVELSDEDSDHSTLLIITHYFNLMDGPLFEKIRGQGLAYHYGFNYNTQTRFLNFYADRALDVIRIYEEVKNFVDVLTQDDDGLNDVSMAEKPSLQRISIIPSWP